jgi:hypothetical protein
MAEPLKPTGTSHLFQARKPPERGNSLTHERIAEHLDAFRQAGGTIEVLGTTRALTRIGVDEAPAPATPPANPLPRKRSR